LRDPRLAREAGLLVGRWHAATATLQHDFAFSRPGAHDTERHLRFLSDAVRECAGHRLIGAVAPLADELTERWASWDGRLDGPARIAHGDLKISNLRFDEAGVGLCLLDLDTMGRLPLDIELGDAWRSWCNRAGEDRADAQLDLELFAASADGYLAAHPLQPEEKEALVPGIERIALELAARFAADALREVYFGWNPAVAATRGEHNLLRAHGQASLARALRQARRPMERALGL
jgi:Ser/Thr protein kinase RdoA (MazF antagonist)